MLREGINVRWDEGGNEYVISYDLSEQTGRYFEVRDSMLSRAVLQLSEDLENENL